MSDYTLDDIARLAGVSRATVSRVVNDHPNVSNKMRTRVQKIIDETDFQLNTVARSLASKETRLIGLVIPRSIHGFFTDPYFPRLITGISQACNLYNYTLSLHVFHSEDEERRIFPRLAMGKSVDGIIVQATGLGQELDPKTSEWKVPHIFAGRPLIDTEVSYLDVDNITGAFNAVMHLIHTGSKRISTITGPLNTAPGLDRLEGYQQALTNRNMEIDDDLIEEGDFSEISAFYAAKRLLKHKPDAIFCGSDTMAVGALRAAVEEGLKVPSELAIVGYDDLMPATLTNPQLTTIRQPIQRFGHKAVEVLLDIIKNGQKPNRRVIFDTELVIRQSCGMNNRNYS